MEFLFLFRRLSGIPKVPNMFQGRMGKIRKARRALGQELGSKEARVKGRVSNS
jgi:hypothetical protein